MELINEKTKKILEILEISKNQFSEHYISIAIPEFLAKKVLTYSCMRNDMLLIKQYIIYMRLTIDEVYLSALCYSLIIIYGKCFTDASTHKYPKLETDIFENRNDLLKTHNFLMNLRHNFIAHRGDTPEEVGMLFLLIPKNDKLKVKTSFKRIKRYSLKEYLDDIKILIDFIIQILDIKIEKQTSKVLESLTKLPQDVLIGLGINGLKF